MKSLKRILPSLGYALGAAGLFLLGDNAQAATLKVIADGASQQFQSVAELLSTGSYLVGAGMAVQAALKFKEHNENPQQVKLSKPVTYALVAGMLLGLPTWMTVGKDSMFGDSQATTTAASGLSFGTTVGGGR